MMSSPPERDVAMESQLTKADLDNYSKMYNQKPIQFNLNDEKRHPLQYQHLTQTGLEKFTEYNEKFEESSLLSMESKGDDSFPTHLHQKQPSYAQSEGYHSYVSSTDSTATPFLDRLRMDSHAMIRSSSWDEAEQDHNMRRGGRDSVVTTSSGNASSSETLKWFGSISDVSVASSSSTHPASSSRQSVVHSARVKTPQRHHSESVLNISSETREGWRKREKGNDNTNKLKFFALNTYTVQEKDANGPSLQSMPSIAGRIREFENQQTYSYLDPNKKHKILNPTLKAIQKQALLSFYERHHSQHPKSNSFRSEPQPVQSQGNFAVPQPPPRAPRIPSRRASSASDYASGTNSRRSSLASREFNKAKALPKIPAQHQHSNSCDSLSTDLLGPIVMGPSISLDDWVLKGPPERPPKKPQLRNKHPKYFNDDRMESPDLPPPSPPTVLEDEVFHCDDPLPPPPPECDLNINQHCKMQCELAAPQVRNIKCPTRQTVGLSENSGNFISVGCRSIKTKPTEQIFHLVSSKPYNVMSSDKNKSDSNISTNSKNDAERTDRRYLTTPKILEGVFDENLERYKQFSSPLRPKVVSERRPACDVQRKSSDDTDNPPPLQPRQMRINQSMRISSSRERSQQLRSSPCEEIRSLRSPVRSQSEASIVSSRRDMNLVVPESDTGRYKRAISLNSHAISSEVSKIKTEEIFRLNKNKEDFLKNNNYKCNIYRRFSMSEKPNKTESSKCDESEDFQKASLVLPDVLPVKVLDNKSCGRMSYPFSTTEDMISKSPLSSHPNSTSRNSMFAHVRLTNVFNPTSLNDTVNLSSVHVPPSEENLNTPSIINTLNPAQIWNDIPKSESPKLSPLSIEPTQCLTEESSSLLPITPVTIKQQLMPSFSMNLSPLKSHLASSETNSPLQKPFLNTSSSPPFKSLLSLPKKSEEGPQMMERSEVAFGVNTTTSDASSQTELPIPLQSRKVLQEEIEFDLLYEDIISQLLNSDKLKEILVPGSSQKKLSDYVHGLFKSEVTSIPRPAYSPIRCCLDTPDDPSSLISNVHSKIELSIQLSNKDLESSGTSSYFVTSESKPGFFTDDQDISQSQLLQNTKDFMVYSKNTHVYKMVISNTFWGELISRLGKKLDVLRGQQLLVDEEFKINEELGESVESHIKNVARPQEAAKFRVHVEEIGKITSLLLGISGRLTRAENDLLWMYEDNEERKTLEAKRDKLISQLEEAKRLKESIDRRSENVCNILTKYLDSKICADYDHFINMKAKLIVNSKEIADQIKKGGEQLQALRESLSNWD